MRRRQRERTAATARTAHRPASALGLKRVAVHLTRAQRERLKAVHIATRLPVAELIRQGVDLVLARYDTEAGASP